MGDQPEKGSDATDLLETWRAMTRLDRIYLHKEEVTSPDRALRWKVLEWRVQFSQPAPSLSPPPAPAPSAPPTVPASPGACAGATEGEVCLPRQCGLCGTWVFLPIAALMECPVCAPAVPATTEGEDA